MQEYISHAVVLDKEGRSKDADAQYALFTERYGKIMATATSSRKITSKLAGHLEPGTLAAVRIIEQRGTRLVDALADRPVAIARADSEPKPSLSDLAALNRLLPEWQPEEELWSELTSGNFSWSRALAILGWDPSGAVCAQCGGAASAATTHATRPPVRHFYIPRQEFFCEPCTARASTFARNQLLLIDG